MTEESRKKKGLTLSARQQRFIDVYLETWNSHEAARQAKYKQPVKQAYQILSSPLVKEEIARRLKESAMEANEALSRLREQATLNPSDFFFFEQVPVLDHKGNVVIDPATGAPKTKLAKTGINWEVVKEKGHLIKGIEYDRRGNVVLKFHDAQNALLNIGRNLKLFTDRVDVNVEGAVKAYVGINPDDWDDNPNPAP